jgi:DNA primase
LAEYLREQDFAVSTAAIIQQFQGTPHEAVLASAEADIMQWGEDFDVGAEFHGILAKLREDQRKQQLQDLHVKAGGSVQGLSEQERERYRQLQQRS